MCCSGEIVLGGFFFLVSGCFDAQCSVSSARGQQL